MVFWPRCIQALVVILPTPLSRGQEQRALEWTHRLLLQGQELLSCRNVLCCSLALAHLGASVPSLWPFSCHWLAGHQQSAVPSEVCFLGAEHLAGCRPVGMGQGTLWGPLSMQRSIDVHKLHFPPGLYGKHCPGLH